MNYAIRFMKLPALILAFAMGLTALVLSFWLLGSTSVVLAQSPPEQAPAGHLIQGPEMQQPTPQIVHVVVFTDPALYGVIDLA